LLYSNGFLTLVYSDLWSSKMIYGVLAAKMYNLRLSMGPCLKHAGTPGQYNRQRRRDSHSLKMPGQQGHCTKSDRRPVSNYHITAKPGWRCRMLMYKEFVFDLREAAAVWN